MLQLSFNDHFPGDSVSTSSPESSSPCPGTEPMNYWNRVFCQSAIQYLPKLCAFADFKTVWHFHGKQL